MRQTLRLTGVELRRLLKCKKTYLLIGINILSIALGYSEFIKGILGEILIGSFSSAGMNYIIYPFCLGGLVGSLLWGTNLILEANRYKKNAISGLIKTYTKEERVSTARILSHILIVTGIWIISAAVYLPVVIVKMDYLFSFPLFLLYAFISMLPGILMTLLLCESLYLISKSSTVSLIVIALLTVVQFTPLVIQDVFLRWNVPQFSEVSDAFGSVGNIRFQLYSRAILLCGLIAIYALTRIFMRKYQFGLFRSFRINGRRPLKFIPVLLFAGLTAFLVIKEPFIDHSPVCEWSGGETYEEIQYQGSFKKKEADVNFNTTLGTLSGQLEIDLEEIAVEELMFYINSGIRVKNVTLDGEKLAFETDYDYEDNDNLNMAKNKGVIHTPGKKNGKLVIEYGGYPAISNSIYRKDGYSFFDSIGPGYIKLGSETVAPEFPSLLGTNEIFFINVPSDHVPTSWGNVMDKVSENPDGTVKWKVDGLAPEIVSAPYQVDPIDYPEIDTVFEYGNRYKNLVAENHMDEAVSDVMQFCDSRYGKLKASDEAESIRIQQISNDYSGGGAGFGWVYMDEAFMSPKALRNENAGANLNETFMHEIIHLFWGDMGCWLEDDGLWSAEGLTVYTTYRIVKEKYGELYAKKYYVDRWQEAVRHQNNNFYFRHPEYLDRLPESYRANVADSEKSINEYCRMPLMLLKAEEKLGGEKAMDEVLKKLYENGGPFGNAENPTTFQDFLDVSGLTEEDLEIE